MEHRSDNREPANHGGKIPALKRASNAPGMAGLPARLRFPLRWCHEKAAPSGTAEGRPKSPGIPPTADEKISGLRFWHCWRQVFLRKAVPREGA